MSRFEIALAQQADDAQLRARMAADFMEGSVAVSFRREPSYFAACRLQGDTTQVVKCSDTSTGGIIGLGSRSTSVAFVNGQATRIGYLADLRLAPQWRRGPLIARGYRMLRRLHTADPVPLYTTVIYEGNTPAFGTLVGGRAGLPHYIDFGRLLTPAIKLDFAVRQMPLQNVTLERGNKRRLPHIVDFLNRERSKKQFAPIVNENHFRAGRFAGLAPENFFLAIRDDRIVATLAAWDQSALRQTHVERYPPLLGLMRPLYNALATLSPLKPLPSPGDRIPYVYLACVATENNDVNLFRYLLRAAHDALRHGPWSFAIAAVHETDPLASVIGELRSIPAAGKLFVVHYPEQPLAVKQTSHRIPCVEAGCL